MSQPRTSTRPIWFIGAILLTVIVLSVAYVWIQSEDFEEQFDAAYVGSETCGSCHSVLHEAWETSPHAKMIQQPSPESVIGDFEGGEYRLPSDSPDPLAGQVVARMNRRGDDYVMSIRHPTEERFVDFPIDRVVGFQYRQEYVTPEASGVLRRLPLQWSTAKQAFFPYWNVQEGSDQTVEDLWAQMRSSNSAWNLYCARCHTTNLEILEQTPYNRSGKARWHEDGITCEACHGPGSLHTEYMRSSPANRLAMWARNHLEGKPVAYIASAAKMPKGQALSVCGRCHGADIFASNQDVYRKYQPGYSRAGKTNDLSQYFQQTPITPGRKFPTLEVWADGEPRGIGMLFRSFIESDCYQQAEVRCFDCHNPHANKLAAQPGLLQPSRASNAYCSACHTAIASDEQAHTKHVVGEPGSFCYDCHMPQHITKLNRGIWERARTHDISSIPDPQNTVLYGSEAAPDACTDCHGAQGAQWAADQVNAW